MLFRSVYPHNINGLFILSVTTLSCHLDADVRVRLFDDVGLFKYLQDLLTQELIGDVINFRFHHPYLFFHPSEPFVSTAGSLTSADSVS